MTRVPLHSRLVEKVEHIRRSVALGRLHAPDPRDLHVATVLPPRREIVVVSRTWMMTYTPRLDQGQVSACVGFSSTNLLLATPVVQGISKLGIKKIGGMAPSDFALDLYYASQRVDEWPGENYEGTSVRAAMKVLQAQGRIKAYFQAKSAAEARDFIITNGPCVGGTNWYERMFVPDAQGYVVPEGEIAGGHAYLWLGYSKTRKAFRILNQWKVTKDGQQVEWGENNRAWLHEEHADQLIREDGECWCPTEIKVA
jgi:hypothetical protein